MPSDAELEKGEYEDGTPIPFGNAGGKGGDDDEEDEDGFDLDELEERVEVDYELGEGIKDRVSGYFFADL